MSTERDDLARALDRTLERQAASVHLRGASFDQVRGTARRIRRRRQAVAAGGTLLALAVAVPTALTLGQPNALRQEAPPATSVPTTTATPEVVTPSPAATPFSSLDLVLMDAPHLAWSRTGTDWKVKARETIALPDGTFQSVTPVGSRWYAVSVDDGGNRSVTVVGSDGSTLATHPVASGPVVSADGSLVAWSDPDGAVLLDWDGAGSPQEQAATGGTTVVAVNGSAPCEPATSCVVTTRDDASPTYPVDVRGDTVAEVTSNDGQGAVCSAVSRRDGGGATELWRTCDEKFLALSPDGSHLLVAPVEGDGAGDSALAVVDTATGSEVARWARGTGPGPTFTTSVWEDDEHVLSVVYESGSWRVVRLGLDGTAEAATASTPGDEGESPYGLALRP